jgi:pantoate--beta-alanine ligase
MIICVLFIFFALKFLWKMKLVHTLAELKMVLDEVRSQGLTVGFVPTMGALHSGHISLVDQAGQQTDFVVVSIFVNPTQFNDPKDLERYPRTLENDMMLLEPSACRLVFAPSVLEMYPETDTRTFDFGPVERVMEGVHRPGHFNGVAQIVSKLFEAVEPNKAFFGLKDFQQLVIIKNMVKQLNMNIVIVPCAIVRETDGLAMSSRNMLLEPEQRANAPLISKTLLKALELKGQMTVDELRKWVVETIDQNPYLETEYFEIVDDEQLQPVSNWDEKSNKVGCITVHCGKVRLIDNITF